MILIRNKSIPINFNYLDAEKLKEASDVLKNGGVIIHPTETLYGFAAVWNNEDALKRVAQLKKRNLKKPFSILVNKINQILDIAGWPSETLKNLLLNIFPNPLTILIPRKKKLALSFWNQFTEIGFRFPDFQICNRLVELVGEPLITTSANIANQLPPKSSLEVSESLINDVDLFLDGGDCPLQIHSTVVRFNPETLHIEMLREGAFPFQKFKEIVRTVYG